MATTDKISYGTNAAFTITLNSLATSTTVGRQSTVVDNSTALALDYLCAVIIATSASALVSPSAVYIYVSGSNDGTNFEQDTAALGTADAGYTIDSPTNLRLARILNCSTSSKTYVADFTIAGLFGGTCPKKFAIVVINNTGQALAATGNSANYTPINYTNG